MNRQNIFRNVKKIISSAILMPKHQQEIEQKKNFRANLNQEVLQELASNFSDIDNNEVGSNNSFRSSFV